MMVLTWLGMGLSHEEESPASSYLITGGVEIQARTAPLAEPLHIEAGSRVALVGTDTVRKHYFCDWILGFIDLNEGSIKFTHGDRTVTSSQDRAPLTALMGRSPLLYGETIQESLLYRTRNVRKAELYHLIERLYGPTLRQKTDPKSPLLDKNGKPIPTQMLTAREHLEIAQINLLLMKTPLVVLDLSSELMKEALEQGFKPSRELLNTGKTILAILPPNKDLAWAEEILGTKFSTTVSF